MRLHLNTCKLIIMLIIGCFGWMLSGCAALATKKEVPPDVPEISIEGGFGRMALYMGDYSGTYQANDGNNGDVVTQVIAYGNGTYQASILQAFDRRVAPLAVLDGIVEGNKVTFAGQGSSQGTPLDIVGTVENGAFIGTFTAGDIAGEFSMSHIDRSSPTLGAKPPQGAITLFDGAGFEAWRHIKKSDDEPVKWRLDNGAMEVMPKTGSIVTRQKFTDFKLHIEFRSPFMPTALGQKRGNSGVYLQGRYEVQVLDSYGLEGVDNECGGIYKVARPNVNMCAPPMQWQTYDITFHGPKFNVSGEKLKNARLTVVHNGVTIHDNIEIPASTGGSLDDQVSEPGGICLQDHADKVQFRNIWLVEL